MQFSNEKQKRLNGPTRPYLAAAMSAVIVLALLACQLPGNSSDGAGGTLTVSINTGSARTLLPPLDMTPASYAISGAGPAGSTFSQSTTGASATVTGLTFGSWTVTASAKNAAGAVIGQGTAAATVDTGKVATVALTVSPVQGTGTLKPTANWTASDLQAASIDAQLLPSTGSAIALPFSMGTGTATAQNSSLAAGYYTLTVKLLDNGALVMGAVEVVRIVQGQTTAGTFDFTQVNKAAGSISIGITPVTSDPFTTSLSGQSAALAVGSAMTVTAATPGYSGNVTYVWYVNGLSKATGSNASPSFTVGSGLAQGIYRLDVTAFSSDGMRAGAATTTFKVQ
jgi:hypothetical protein